MVSERKGIGRRRGGLAALRHRDFALLFSGTLVSHTGDILQSMAVQWLVFQLTHSALKLAVIGFCQLLPRLILGTLGGVIVDRVDRRRLLINTQVVAMLQSALLFGLVLTKAIAFWHITLLTVILGVADTLHLTARHSLVPSLVPQSELQEGVALNAAGFNVTQVVGPALGGALLSLVGTSGCLAINTVSFVAILGALFFMKWRPPPVTRTAQTSILTELGDGFRFVAGREALWVPVMLAYGMASLAMAYSRLMPVFATQVLHGGEHAYGALMAAPGVGAVVASLAIALRGRRPRALRRLYRAAVGLCAALSVFAVSRSMWLSVAALVALGCAQMVFRTTAMATLHENTDDAHRGRVVSIFLLDYGLWSFGTLWLGWLCDAHGPSLAVLVGAGSCLACTAAVALVSRRLRSTLPACDAARSSSSSR